MSRKQGIEEAAKLVDAFRKQFEDEAYDAGEVRDGSRYDALQLQITTAIVLAGEIRGLLKRAP